MISCNRFTFMFYNVWKRCVTKLFLERPLNKNFIVLFRDLESSRTELIEPILCCGHMWNRERKWTPQNRKQEWIKKVLQIKLFMFRLCFKPFIVQKAFGTYQNYQLLETNKTQRKKLASWVCCQAQDFKVAQAQAQVVRST